MPNILDLSARLSADVRPFVNSMASGANASHSTFQNIAQAATMYLGARGLLGTLNRANQASMEFGQSLADASAISTLSVKEIGDALMSLDNVFGRVTKASQSMYRILSSGFSQLDANQLVEFQKAVGVSAKVIRADLYNTADVMTTIANAYQLNIKEIEKLQDWFYITVREGKAQGQDLARTLGLVINSASEAGVSLNELGAAIAVLSRTQSVSQSMIGLNQMLNAFIKPTLQAQAAARKWGIEISATALQEKGLTAILKELNQKVGGNVEALEKMFGNIRAGRAILSLTGKQFHNYLNVVDMYNHESGAGMEAFEKQIDTVQNAYERLQAQQEKTLIDIGDDWGGVRKVIYNVGETLLKAFSDTSPIARWGVYLTGINLATKNIIAVIKNLKDSVNSVTGSVDRLTASFTRASAASKGLNGTGIRPDIARLRKKAAQANLALTGDFKPLLERHDQILRGATPWFNLKNQPGIAQKNNPYAVIAQNMLNPNVREHQLIAQGIAKKFMKQYFVKYEDIVDPVTGKVTDWKVMNAETGYRYKATNNQLEKQLTKSVFIQNNKSMDVLRKFITSARKTKLDAEAEEKRLIRESNMRVGNFYSQPEGFRRGTINRLHRNQTSMMRLADMKQARFAKNHAIMNWMGLNPYDRGTGIGRWWMERSRGRAFQYRGKTIVQDPNWFFKAGNKIGAGLGKEFGKFTSSIGKTIGVAFNAMAAIGMMKFAWDFGKKIGESIGESLNLKDTAFFQWLGRALTTGDFMGLGPSTSLVEQGNIKTQAFTMNQAFIRAIEDAKKANLSPDKILQYQERMYNAYSRVLNFDPAKDSIAGLQSSADEMHLIISELNGDLAEYRDRRKDEERERELYAALKPTERDKELNTAEKSYIRSYMAREGSAMSKNTRTLFDEFIKHPADFVKAVNGLKGRSKYNLGGMRKYLTDMGLDVTGIEFSNMVAIWEGLNEVLAVAETMSKDKNVKKANQVDATNKLVAWASERADMSLKDFNKVMDKRENDRQYNEVKSTYFDNLNELDTEDGLKAARLTKALSQLADAMDDLEAKTNAATKTEQDMEQAIIDANKQLGGRITEKQIQTIRESFQPAFTSEYSQVVEAQKAVIKARSTVEGERDRMRKYIVETGISGLTANMRDLITAGSFGRRYNPATGRMDGEYKNSGWRGIRLDGKGGIMTEVSRGLTFDGKQVEFPLIIPDSTEEELEQIAKIARGEFVAPEIVKKLENKAWSFATKRISQGKSPFFNGDFEDEMLRNLVGSQPVATSASIYGTGKRNLVRELSKNPKLKNTPAQMTEALDKYQAEYIKNVKNNADIVGEKLTDVAVDASTGSISKRAAIKQQKSIIYAQWKIFTEALNGLDPKEDAEAIKTFKTSANGLAEKYNSLIFDELALDIQEIARGFDTVDLARAQHRITERNANIQRLKIYQDMRKEVNKQLKNVVKDSEQYNTLMNQRNDIDKNIAQLRDAIQNDVNEARSGLLSVFSDIISSNMQGDRLSNYGLYHATNLLAHLAPGLNIQQQGVSLSQVLANANARYSGSTPDTSRAMQQQQRLSTIMDSYIASKQYQDAGIGKNVETIVTIMGKRTPLFLN